ncbi:carboxymethylenebutenolidase [Actinocorallia herbida]|uniref:Carboxymethylenebutenolidase n=1 Tax=Actinocorallia herbida TaxID=58109 RepID=A0A3N1CS77_9ACTN|nr:dienelactone hydrolase family protein [Actinocorallia herbida]ROO84147.1 carboxymethylenebutenolidase [Actinocorallia herbida]
MNQTIDSADAFTSGTIPIPGHQGDEIEAYLARPLAAAPRGGVIVLHHMPGYDEGSKEIVRRFAARGYNAIMPNLHYRDAPGADPDDAAAASRANGGVPDERLVGDAAGAAARLRGLPNANGRVGVIGYCSGGRQAFLAACSLDLDAAVDCYGAFVTAHSPDGYPVVVPPVVGLAKDLACPLLGLFGADDKFPAPSETAELSAVLTELGKEFEFHTYEGAGHAFFSVNRPAYRPEAAVSGWARVFDFYGRHLHTR